MHLVELLYKINFTLTGCAVVLSISTLWLSSTASIYNQISRADIQYNSKGDIVLLQSLTDWLTDCLRFLNVHLHAHVTISFSISFTIFQWDSSGSIATVSLDLATFKTHLMTIKKKAKLRI